MNNKQTYKCVISGKNIPKERIEALKMLGIPEQKWTCVEYALPVPRKGIYLGEVGTSQLLIVDKVYNDSVRSVFKGAKKQAEQLDREIVREIDDSADEPVYNEKELSYYISNEEQSDPDEKINIIKRQL